MIFGRNFFVNEKFLHCEQQNSIMSFSEKTESFDHLLIWCNAEARKLGSKVTHYSLRSMIELGNLALVLQSVDASYFTKLNELTKMEDMEEIMKIMEEYIIEQCGKRIKVSLKLQILKQFRIETLINLALFTCLHCKKKKEFILTILQLGESVQDRLMKSIQDISNRTQNIMEIKEIIFKLEELELEVESLRKQLCVYTSRQEHHITTISELENDLKRSNKDIKQFKNEKQVAIETLKLENFEEYLTSFQKLQSESSELHNFIKELEAKNLEHINVENELRQYIRDQITVINELNDELSYNKEKYSKLLLQKIHFSSHEQICDNRSLSNDSKNLTERSIDECDCRAKSSEKFWKDDETSRLMWEEEQSLLKSEITQIKEENLQLVEKLEGAYKSVQFMTEQSTHLKQKNRALRKENKFIKKKIEQLTRVQFLFEKRFNENNY